MALRSTSRRVSIPRCAGLAVAASLVCAVAATACSDETGLRVVVDSDIQDLGSFEIAIWSGELRREDTLRSRRIFVVSGDDGVELPASLGIVPREGDALRRVRIEVVGYTPRGMVASAVTTGFVEGETREVRIVLLESCENVRCEQGLTCAEDGCEPEARPAALLPRVGERPRPRPDASPPARDLGPRDGGVVGPDDDARVPDGASTPPPSPPPPPDDAATPPPPPPPPPDDMGTPTSRCREGFELRGRSCYATFDEHVDWVTAEMRCNALDAHLASIASDVESMLAATSGSVDAPWWIGLGPSPVMRGAVVPLTDTDRSAVGVCASSVAPVLEGEAWVHIDSEGATHDVTPMTPAMCVVDVPGASMLVDVGFTVTLARRELLVVRGVASTGAAVVFAIDGGCASPYPADECALIGEDASAVTFARGPGTLGVLAEVFFAGDVDLYVAALHWTSGEPLDYVSSAMDSRAIPVDSVPCMVLTRDGEWRLSACSEARAYVCEHTPLD